MRNYVEYFSIRRRMQRTQLKSLFCKKNQFIIEFSPVLTELPREYLRPDQVVTPYLYLTVNSLLHKRYLDFTDYVKVLDDNFSLALREFIALERQMLFVDTANKDFLQKLLSLEAKLLLRLMLSWQKFLQGDLSMREMLDRIEDLQMRLQEYNAESRVRELFGDVYLAWLEEIVSNLAQAYKIKEQADTIRLNLSKHKCMQNATLSQQSTVDLDPVAVKRNSEVDYIVIDILNQGLFSAKQLSSRDLNDAEFRRRSSLVETVMAKQNMTLALSAVGLVVGALIVVTDGLIVPFLPVLEFALMEIITIAGCAVVGVGAGALLEHKRATAISLHS